MRVGRQCAAAGVGVGCRLPQPYGTAIPPLAYPSAVPTPDRPTPQLTPRQRKALRGRAHPLQPLVLVGHAGIDDRVLRSVDDALAAHELVKVRLHEPEDKRAAATALAAGTGAALCGLVGHTVILYRPHPEHPTIVLA